MSRVPPQRQSAPEPLPDLITPEDERRVSEGTTPVRFRVTVTDQGVEVLADSPDPRALDRLLADAGFSLVEVVLCG